MRWLGQTALVTTVGLMALAAGTPLADAAAASSAGRGQGVTDSTIKVGVAILDTSKIASLGLEPPNYTTQGEKDAANAYIDLINSSGGINGRRIDPVFVTTDPLNTGTSATACQTLTEDDNVFAVIGTQALSGAANQCVTTQNRTPLLDSGTPTADYSPPGYLISSGQSSSHEDQDWAIALSRLGVLKGKTIGVLSDATKDPDVKRWLVSTLNRLGYRNVFVYTLSSDIGTAASQVPIAVQQMESHRVNALLVPTSFLNLDSFTQDADKQGYRPKYLVSDENGLNQPSLVAHTAPGFNGAIAITANRVNDAASKVPEQAVDKQCRQAYNAYAHTDLAYGQFPYTETCAEIRVFDLAATKAGPKLTAGLLRGLRSPSGIDRPTRLLRRSLRQEQERLRRPGPAFGLLDRLQVLPRHRDSDGRQALEVTPPPTSCAKVGIADPSASGAVDAPQKGGDLELVGSHLVGDHRRHVLTAVELTPAQD